MATRFITKALSIAALGIALSFLFAGTTTTSPAWRKTPGAPQLDPPAAPSDCSTTTHYDRRKGEAVIYVSWSDNSTNEDGFIFETWRRQSGAWIPAGSFSLPADSTSVMFPGRVGSGVKFRVKAFNAAGESDWSNWAH